MSSDGAPARKPMLFVVSSPSGAGKTTLTRRLMEEFDRLTFSISYTTRPPREGEVDGEDYHFVDEATFARMVAEDAFAEHATVHGNRYGTADAQIHEAFAAGRDVLFDIDYQGGRQLKAKYPAEAVMVFVLPPTMEALAGRLRRRATDTEEIIRRRLAKAVDELGHYHAYEYLVVNDDLEAAYERLRAIYLASSCRWDRRSPMAEALIAEAEAPGFRRHLYPEE
jgi:guanylate kinase